MYVDENQFFLGVARNPFRILTPCKKNMIWYYQNMKKICLIFAMCFTMFAVPAHAADFVPGFEDIPLQTGVYAVVDDVLVYSIPDGKIIQTTVASDDVSRCSFQRFYRDVLKQLGWTIKRDERAGQEFVRGDDHLTIEILETDPLAARFEMKPK